MARPDEAQQFASPLVNTLMTGPRQICEKANRRISFSTWARRSTNARALR
jgi:hypothetical protein